VSNDETTNATVFPLEPGNPANSAEPTSGTSTHGARTKRQARHARGVTELFDARRELRGVYAPADLVEEFTRWTA
jgi:hypothetical protein